MSLQAGSQTALALWSVQIALNAVWTPIFFGLKKMRAGLGFIIALWVAVVATCLGFFQFDTIAGLLFIPYIIWVSTAASLNYMVIKLNPEAVT